MDDDTIILEIINKERSDRDFDDYADDRDDQTY